MFDIAIETIEDVKVIKLDGELDGMGASVAQQQVQPLAKAGHRILFDVSGVTSTTSAGIRLFLVTYRYTSNSGGKLILAGLRPDLEGVLAVTGFLKSFTVCQTVQDGLQQFRSDSVIPAEPNQNPE
ncbi:MAG: STAS domain-containing protein [Anaerolineae bacterium]|nr:STAS domain-containing protein [Anaerolineae bacterium]